MNGRRAKELRRKARELNGSRYSTFKRIEHRPRPILDFFGRLLGQVDCWTDCCGGFRRAYQDLKRERGLRRSGTRELTMEERQRCRQVLRREAGRRERACRRAERRQEARDE